MDRRVDDKLLPAPPLVSLPDLLICFLKLGAASFGGGVAGWVHREIVERRQWLSEERFLETLTVAQVMPGANPVNLAVYVGMQLRGFAGAAVAATAMVVPAFCIILLLGAGYGLLGQYPEASIVLVGLACVGIGATLTMGIKAARRLKGQIVPILIAIAIFVTVGLLRWPMIPVVLLLTPVSILASYLLERRAANG